ncbi:heterogeneous nuclear ribonucleoprotein L-like isoform X2 [Macrosteles quadrilineatus]|uniref:heterogeneous nuclear ribonucleoprotein L-like isoform X2 n=1 Tax=Macrosteles quadrilineatus TaxID=74068 RepID=UPI0023E28B17|nr:heterogeneous nuclear ribonucleoprotein L-like isoform X2 [Macrosteles quadrilineatus]XP_054282676.1 heterogeneous nuclear ribonucleoprotein L-like isoform X2 [Macrosteles quadrilineatus]
MEFVDTPNWREPSYKPPVFISKLWKCSTQNHTSEQYTNNFNEELRRKRPENLTPNHVLLFTIVNPLYPITVHVLHTICSPIGQVQRIVIFKKNGVQAMVEFDSVDTAKRVKEELNGADIYSGCCTIKIEFAKPTKLNVHKNDSESWDYTTPTPAKAADAANRPAPLLADPRFTPGPTPYNKFTPARRPLDKFPKKFDGPWDDERGDGLRGGYVDQYDDNYNNEHGYDHYGERFPPPPPHSGPMDSGFVNGNRRYMGRGEGMHPGPPAPRGPGYGLLTPTGPPNGTQTSGGGCVMMVYGLDKDKVNPDKLFNIFCLYGNVIKIKFLKTKEGCAMIQMGDTISVERCISNLNNTSVGEMQIQLGFSKQAFLSDVAQPYNLPDSSPSFKDFMGSKNNRFINPTMASKNRIQGPSKVLHFFNTPPNITEDVLRDIFYEKCELRPNVQLFPMKGDRSSSGLLEFQSVEKALLALMLCNHHPVKNPSGKFPYVMKLCFSSNRFPVNLNFKSEPLDAGDKE